MNGRIAGLKMLSSKFLGLVLVRISAKNNGNPISWGWPSSTKACEIVPNPCPPNFLGLLYKWFEYQSILTPFKLKEIEVVSLKNTVAHKVG
jgi:hypothetical protein